jgi:hypothetical protein
MSGEVCTDWIDGEDVAACCDVESSDGTIFDTVAHEASALLFQLSGRQFAGTCSRTVRPCRTRCAWPLQVLSRGYVVTWAGWGWGWGYGWQNWWGAEVPCGCRHLSTVRLAGYPVQSVDEVKIDGAVVDPATYRLDRMRKLVRVRPSSTDDFLMWPSCQALDLPDTESGTFSVTYTYGQDPPELGRSAAAQLACELYKSCQGQACALPRGTVRATRQGVTIDKVALMDFVFVPTKLASRGSVRTSGWRTGMTLVDAFLNSANGAGLIRRPVFWSAASSLQYPIPQGEIGGS